MRPGGKERRRSRIQEIRRGGVTQPAGMQRRPTGKVLLGRDTSPIDIPCLPPVHDARIRAFRNVRGGGSPSRHVRSRHPSRRAPHAPRPALVGVRIRALASLDPRPPARRGFPRRPRARRGRPFRPRLVVRRSARAVRARGEPSFCPGREVHVATRAAMMRQLRRNPFTCVPGGGLRSRADMSTVAGRRGPAVDGRGSLEPDSVSLIRSARVRRYAVMFVAVIIVVWAVRFVFAPIPQM